MYFFTHGAFGAALTHMGCHAIGIYGEADIISTASAGIIGTVPDTLDWALAKLGLTERWKVYGWFHHPEDYSGKFWNLLLQWILYPMAFHTQVFDKLIHSPMLPTEEDISNIPYLWPFKDVKRLWWFLAKRRDVFWTLGDLMLWFLSSTLWLITYV